MHSTFSAFFDANVFYGARLRSFVMEAAKSGLFRARWSKDVHDEWMGNLLSRRQDLAREKIVEVRELMDRAVPDCLVTGYEGLIDALNLPDPDDRHVLAAAIIGRCDVIVTFNLKDFPEEVLRPFRIHATHPDQFFAEVEGVDPGALVEAAARDLAHYVNPPLTLEKYTEDFRKAGCSGLADYLLRMRVMIEP